MEDGRDPKTGIPIKSLYGNQTSPTLVEGLDWVIYDIQDVGIRFYPSTTLSYVIDACVEAGVPRLWIGAIQTVITSTVPSTTRLREYGGLPYTGSARFNHGNMLPWSMASIGSYDRE